MVSFRYMEGEYMKPAGWIWNYLTQKYDKVLQREDGKTVIIPILDKYPRWTSVGVK